LLIELSGNDFLLNTRGVTGRHVPALGHIE
jgi:hypothetical protein